MRTILFVEDEAILQKTFGDMLGSVGYKVISAMDGEAAVRLAKTQKPDLVLLDLILPKMSGFEVLKALKEDPNTRLIPVIILSNMEGMVEIEKALSLGATTYLVKTQYTLKEVTEKISKAIGK